MWMRSRGVVICSGWLRCQSQRLRCRSRVTYCEWPVRIVRAQNEPGQAAGGIEPSALSGLVDLLVHPSGQIEYEVEAEMEEDSGAGLEKVGKL